ncbi:hypothetical protein L3X38_037974 [Prunus dulcis]|uniref:Uncharacterized protein n=1 Tax=Prunus dulcis TaxID=3755 RepID=A0AAD4V5M9_PRUDU|nr:hypothetical protein L3X38_037974 [Prunus dulcis]
MVKRNTLLMVMTVVFAILYSAGINPLLLQEWQLQQQTQAQTGSGPSPGSAFQGAKAAQARCESYATGPACGEKQLKAK